MCAPHQATLMADCTVMEAAGLLAVAGYNANREYLDLYLRATAENEIFGMLVRVARDREVLRTALIALPDTAQGGRQALDTFRRWYQGDSVVASPADTTSRASTAQRHCCH